MIEILEDLRLQLAQKDVQIARLTSELDQLKRMIFGKKSERFIPAPGQLSLDGLDVPVSTEAPVETTSVAPKVDAPVSKPSRQPINPSLPVDITELNPVVDPLEYQYIGREESSHLEYIPAQLIHHKTIRNKYKHRLSGEIVIAPMPHRPFAKHIAGASVIATVAVEKYVDHLPLNRQIQRWDRLGVKIAPSTISDWLRSGYGLLGGLYDCLKKEILSSRYIQCDESPYPVLSDDKKGATHRGYQWVYYDPLSKLVLYDYRPGRGKEGPVELLKDFKGYLQTDGYAVYDQFDQREDISLVGCMAHARRYFEQAIDNDKARAEYFLSQIQRLYDLERLTKEADPDERQEQRQKQAIPILEQMEQWLKENLHQVTPQSKIGKAIAYSYQRWNKLKRYCQEDILRIDNNLVENTIRPMVIGRKNYLFAGSHDSAIRAACYYSLLISCRQLRINPAEWLLDVFNRIEETKPSVYRDLLPHRWKKEA